MWHKKYRVLTFLNTAGCHQAHRARLNNHIKNRSLISLTESTPSVVFSRGENYVKGTHRKWSTSVDRVPLGIRWRIWIMFACLVVISFLFLLKLLHQSHSLLIPWRCAGNVFEWIAGKMVERFKGMTLENQISAYGCASESWRPCFSVFIFFIPISHKFGDIQ